MTSYIVLSAAAATGAVYCIACRRSEGCDLLSCHSLCLLLLLAAIPMPAILVAAKRHSLIDPPHGVITAVAFLCMTTVCGNLVLFVAVFVGLCSQKPKQPLLARSFALVALFLFPSFFISMVSARVFLGEFIGG